MKIFGLVNFFLILQIAPALAERITIDGDFSVDFDGNGSHLRVGPNLDFQDSGNTYVYPSYRYNSHSKDSVDLEAGHTLWENEDNTINVEAVADYQIAGENAGDTRVKIKSTFILD
ncbi:MAG: hypothetical protein AAFW75_16100 [Cyanobacteria bacterium J06636_16]